MGYSVFMKTTIEISDHILLSSKHLARQRNVTLRSLVEEGLMRVADEMDSRKQAKVKPVTFRGKGLSPDFERSEWRQIRNAIYKTGS